ncbi:hypothetical protein AGMMS49990_05090 [Endomicrobiia bacterium]|nr:hypothetical protein AGMMS49990_05090 [Endomicrobiia bacterium]
MSSGEYALDGKKGLLNKVLEVEVAVIDAADVIKRPKKTAKVAKAGRKRDIQ